jgi:ribosomal protein L37AE/L43A
LNAVFQSDIAALLERAGARPRGNRHDCPQCGGRRTVTHGGEVFFCHKCGWKGNRVTLERALGLRREWIPSAEYIRRQRQRERANEAARVLYERVKARRFALYDEWRALGLDGGVGSDVFRNYWKALYARDDGLDTRGKVNIALESFGRIGIEIPTEFRKIAKVHDREG